MAWLACIWDRWCSSWRLSMARKQRDVAAAVRDKLWPLEAGRPVHHGQIYRCRHLAPPIRQACRCPTARRAVGGVYGSLGAWHRPPAGCVACELSGQPKSTVGRRAGECRHCSDLPAMPPHVARRPSRLALMPAYAMHGPQDRFRGPVVVFRTTAAMFRRRAAAAAVLLVLAAAAATVDAGVSTCRAVPPLLPLELACSTRWERSGLRGTLQTYHGSCAGGLSGAQTQLTPARPNSCSRVRPQGWQQEVQAAKRVLQHQRKCRCRPLARPRRCCPRLFAPPSHGAAAAFSRCPPRCCARRAGAAPAKSSAPRPLLQRAVRGRRRHAHAAAHTQPAHPQDALLFVAVGPRRRALGAQRPPA